MLIYPIFLAVCTVANFSMKNCINQVIKKGGKKLFGIMTIIVEFISSFIAGIYHVLVNIFSFSPKILEVVHHFLK